MNRQFLFFASCGVSLMMMGNVVRIQAPAAQTPVCYWESAPGSTIEVSRLCGTGLASPASPGIILPASLKRYPETVQKQVQTAIQANPRRFLTQARTTCRVLRYGGVNAANVQRQALTQSRSDAVFLAQQQMVADYAIANYCPQFR